MTPGTPGTPVTPGTPGTPGTPVTPVTPTKPELPSVEVDEEETPHAGVDKNGGVPMLPKTGEASPLPYYLAGLTLVAWGVYAKRRSMKRK
ncbi:hypothetical protein D3C73_1308060 [compost metagenome]